MYLVIRCSDCRRFISKISKGYLLKKIFHRNIFDAKEGQKTRACPCGQKVLVSKMRIYARVDDERKAGDAVRFLQEKEFGKPHFRMFTQ
ncbi:MAG: DUF1922 domain-containing protein [Methanosarcinales archaeon Met12]|nr:MAG: DUF1922 domain-containing protein [Methanosarcinales archaeon Met12]